MRLIVCISVSMAKHSRDVLRLELNMWGEIELKDQSMPKFSKQKVSATCDLKSLSELFWFPPRGTGMETSFPRKFSHLLIIDAIAGCKPFQSALILKETNKYFFHFC